jgi:hypothetical protein
MSTALSCPACGHDVTHVTDSRPRWIGGINAVYRRRKCAACEEKFSTIETAGSVQDHEARLMAARLLKLASNQRLWVENLLDMLDPVATS